MDNLISRKNPLKHKLSNISNNVGALVFVALAASIATLDLVFGVTLRDVPLHMFGVTITMALAVLVFLLVKQVKTRLGTVILHTYIHCVAYSAFILWLPFPSPYFIYILGIALFLYYEFGARAVIFSIVISGLFISSQYPLRDNLAPQAFQTFLIYFAITLILGVYMTIFLRIAEDERRALQKITEEIELERSRLLTLVNNINDTVVACDTNFSIMLLNSQAHSLLNTNDSLKGRKLDGLLDLRDTEGKSVKLSHLADTDKRVNVYTSYRLYYSHNDFINLYIAINQIRHGGKLTGYVILLRDITKLKTLEEERNEFVNIMSHELRTPVTIVEGGISLAQEYTKQKKLGKIAEYLQKAHDQSLMLSAIVRSLSMLVNSEKGSEKLQVSEVEPQLIINKVKQTYLQEIHEKGLRLAVRCDPNLRTIYTAEDYLYEILQNLMTNAIKYTKDGTITISAKATNNAYIAFSVSDTGIGISKSDLGHIFEKFWRSENYKTRKSGGTGLGLYLTKKLAENLGARIEVESKLGEGSTFIVHVPVYDTQEV